MQGSIRVNEKRCTWQQISIPPNLIDARCERQRALAFHASLRVAPGNELLISNAVSQTQGLGIPPHPKPKTPGVRAHVREVEGLLQFFLEGGGRQRPLALANTPLSESAK
jgi:hypothetical protein